MVYFVLSRVSLMLAVEFILEMNVIFVICHRLAYIRKMEKFSSAKGRFKFV